ncbi:MAG: DUF4214 domain-containing protein [Lachnospiraceae bacterium]|nr:DUF4214 domain-containing protein [Lachnospiraceae bacterium]
MRQTKSSYKILGILISFALLLTIMNIPIIKAKASGTVDDFVERCYQVTLDRNSDPDGMADWKGQLLNGEAVGVHVAYGFLFSAEYTKKNKSPEDYVTDLYMLFMGREPDEAGFEDWVGQLKDGKSRVEVFAGFANSQEFYNICESYGITCGRFVVGKDRIQVNNVNLFVERLYKITLGRIGDKDGQRNWVEKLINKQITGSECARAFIFSQEYTNKGLSDEEFVENLYLAMMGRPSDAGGKENWLNALASGKTRDEVFAGFANSTEFANICATYKIDKGTYTAKEIGKELQKTREVSRYCATRSLSGVLEMQFSSNGNGSYTHYCYMKENGEVIIEFNALADRRLYDDGNFYINELTEHWFGGKYGLTYQFSNTDKFEYKILGYENNIYLVERKNRNNTSNLNELLLMDKNGNIQKTFNIDLMDEDDTLNKALYLGEDIWIIQLNEDYSDIGLVFNCAEGKSFKSIIPSFRNIVEYDGILMIYGCKLDKNDFVEMSADDSTNPNLSNKYAYGSLYLGEGYWQYDNKLYRYDVNNKPINVPTFQNTWTWRFGNSYFGSYNEMFKDRFFSNGYVSLIISSNDNHEYVTVMDGNGKALYNPIKAGSEFVQSDGKMIIAYLDSQYVNDKEFYLIDKQGNKSKKLNIPYDCRIKDFDGKFGYFEEGVYSVETDSFIQPFYSNKTFVTNGSEKDY